MQWTARRPILAPRTMQLSAHMHPIRPPNNGQFQVAPPLHLPSPPQVFRCAIADTAGGRSCCGLAGKCLGLARSMYIRCLYGVLSREITKKTSHIQCIYGAGQSYKCHIKPTMRAAYFWSTQGRWNADIQASALQLFGFDFDLIS
jgi:hypothetical protein